MIVKIDSVPPNHQISRYQTNGVPCLACKHTVPRSLTLPPLSNLDQDLPNALQQRLTIYSLPEGDATSCAKAFQTTDTTVFAEWLWCETWCTDQSLTVAKSIDLCQNPMTKEGKLDIAKVRNARELVVIVDWIPRSVSTRIGASGMPS